MWSKLLIQSIKTSLTSYVPLFVLLLRDDNSCDQKKPSLDFLVKVAASNVQEIYSNLQLQ